MLQFRTNFHNIYGAKKKKIGLSCIFDRAIWDEYSKRHQQQRIKKAPYLMHNSHFFGAN